MAVEISPEPLLKKQHIETEEEIALKSISGIITIETPKEGLLSLYPFSYLPFLAKLFFTRRYYKYGYYV